MHQFLLQLLIFFACVVFPQFGPDPNILLVVFAYYIHLPIQNLEKLDTVTARQVESESSQVLAVHCICGISGYVILK